MTLLDVRNQIISHFCEKDSFTRNDFINVEVDQLFEDQKDNLILSCLIELEKREIIVKISDSLWILTNPLNFSGQKINISMAVANAITETVNTFLEANNIEDTKVDSLNITEANIVDLLKIIGEILNNDE